MKYSHIIENFTWSYSRITTFEMCPYQFFLTYIKPVKKQPLFFSDYGTFIHKIIEKHLNGELEENQLVPYYLQNFRTSIHAKAPTQAVFETYFNQGLDYLRNIHFPYPTPLAVEQRVDFFIDKYPFVGIIDCVAEESDGIVILDNKSRTLKPRSNRKKPTRSDEELDKYLRQLYLYSAAVKDLYGTYPVKLCFNCFRSCELISEPFLKESFESAKAWTLSSIEQIVQNDEWGPDMDYWKCKYLCDVRDQCDYWQMNRQ